MECVAFDGDVSKKCFSFPDDDRSSLNDVKIGSVVTLVVNDKNGDKKELKFRVTRNTYIGMEHWVYGQVVSSGDVYLQVEIKIRENSSRDTIEVFPQAPPARII